MARVRVCTNSGSDFTDLTPFEFPWRRGLSPAPSLLRSTADRELLSYHLPQARGHQKREALTLDHLLGLRHRVELGFEMTPADLQLRQVLLSLQQAAFQGLLP